MPQLSASRSLPLIVLLAIASPIHAGAPEGTPSIDAAPIAIDRGPIEVPVTCATPGPNGQSNMCGLRFQVADETGWFSTSGCSCEADCGFAGACCPDVNAVCGATDGTQWLQRTSSLASSTSSNGAGPRPRHLLVDGRSENAPASSGGSVAGLTQVRLVDIDSKGEQSECSVESNGDYWTVAASTNFDDNHATCQALGISWPEDRLELGTRTEAVAGDGTESTVVLGDFPASKSAPLLQRIRMEDVDNDDSTHCTVVRDDATDRWHLRALSEGDSNAWCSAQLVNLEDSGAGLVERCPADRNSPDPPGASYSLCDRGVFEVLLDERVNDGLTSLSTSMLSEGHHACFLTEVGGAHQNDRDEPLSCQITRQRGRWWLEGASRGGYVKCRAQCIELHDGVIDPAVGWPPVPSRIVVDQETSPTGQWGYGSFGQERLEPGGADVIVDQTLGARLELYQSGPYDKPIVLFEGFDPSNRHSGGYHLRFLGLIARALSRLGLDLWFVELDDGGQDIRDIARRNARAVQIAWEHEGWGWAEPDRKLIAVGISMGALTGRFLLSSWEDGLYAGDGAEAIPGITSPQAPVSVFAAINGPQLGANIPLALQMPIRDIAHDYDLGDQEEALASLAAKQMLEARIAPSCRNVVTEECNYVFGSARTFVDGTTRVFGQTVFRSSNGSDPPSCSEDFQCWPFADGCYDYPPTGGRACGHDFSTQCPFDNLDTHRDLFADLNSRGRAGDGWPQTVTTLGLTSGAFTPLDFTTLAKGTACSDWDPNCPVGGPLSEATVLGSMRFRDTGQTFLDICQRDTRIFGHVGASDLRSGDTSGRSLADIALGELPKSTSLEVRQNFPFMHIPTRSALACAGASSHEECAALTPWNFIGSSDMAIHPEEMGRHNGHAILFDYHAVQLMAWLADGYFGDADGYCDAANPFASTLEEFRGSLGYPADAGCFGPQDLAPDSPGYREVVFADDFESGTFEAWS